MKKSRNFDDWIKENLDQYDPDLKNKDAVWDKLKSTLQNHEHEEKLFDESIKNKFQQFDAKAPKSDWNHFLVKYKERAARRKRILGIRIAELSLVILLLWTFDQFYKQYEPLHKTLHAKFQKQNTIDHQKLTIKKLQEVEDLNSKGETTKQASNKGLAKSGLQKQKSNSPKVKTISSTLSSISSGDGSNQPPNSKNFNSVLSPSAKVPAIDEFKNSDFQNSINGKAKSTPHNQNSSQNSNEVISLKNSTNQNSDAGKVDHDPAILENTIYIDQSNDIESSKNNITNHTKPTNDKGSNENLDLTAVVEAELNLLELRPTEIKFLPNPNFIDLPRYKPVLFSDFGIWLSGHAGAGINFIKTPQDILLGNHSLNRIGQTSNAGLKIMFDHGRWILESGLNYSFLSDQPKVCDIYKNYSGEFHKTELLVNEYQLLEIPILAHVVVLFTDQINWTVGGGISIAANIASQYQKHDLLYPERPPQGISFLPRASYLDEKMYNEGLLNREAFNENSFANLILQSRVVYKHRSDVQFFGEIQLKNMLSSYGFGPLSDRYKQLGLNLGISKKI